MTNGRASDTKRHFVLTWLPWILGLAALGLYLITLNRSLSFLPEWMAFFGAAPSGVRIAGWNWQPELFAPAYFAVTFPLHWLPPTIAPIATNLFSTVCAALVLVQLARCVALLPHDRTRDQRDRTEDKHALLTFSLAWLPPVFAVLVCALGLNFWEHSTNGTVEMFDLLLFAYVVRALLEYRIDDRETRLYRAAFVFGVGMSSNPAMIGFFPFFVLALVWSRQLAFFNLRFLGRMALWGFVGLLFYLLLPAIASMAQDSSTTFWQALKTNLIVERQVLTFFRGKTLLLLSLTSVLPIFLLSIRWASQFGDPSRIGAVLTTIIFHFCHIVVLLACLWVAFDPPFSPRKVGMGFAFLPLYFLGALAVGYYSGYLLLVSRAISTRLRPASGPAQTIQHVTTVAIGILLIATPLALLYRNYPQIRLTNGSWQNQVAADLASGLPPNGVILSDDPLRLLLVQDWLARQGRSGDFIALNTHWLKQPEYHRALKRRYPDWVTPTSNNPDARTFNDNELVNLLLKLASEKPVYYLHPSFGYYFEFFVPEPAGLGAQLRFYPGTNLIAPQISSEVIARNEKFWAGARAGVLKTLLPVTRPPDETRRLSLIEKFFAALQVTPDPDPQLVGMGALYSRSLVSWGVALQRAGQPEKAGPHFALATELNPDNVAAQVNLETNKKLQAGENLASPSKLVEDWFGKYRSWEEALNQNGPFDEPTRTYAQGYVFAQGNLLRQAAQEFNRVRNLVTNDLASRLWLAQLNLTLNFPDQALAMASEVRDCATLTPGASTNLTDLFTLEASAYFAKKEPEAATRLIEENLKANQDNLPLMGAACRTYADNRRYTNALDVTERMIAQQPENPVLWLNRGCFLVELNNYDDAIKSFDRVINLESTNYTAILYRAIANLRSDKLDDALRDYETVQRQFPKQYQVFYGLAEIAYRRKDTNTALRHYESYLSNTPPNFPEANFVAGRIRELRGEPPEPEK
ncbi:MAG TPA: tetratricopeptide repeat protein [Verrucomicrobiae bacterium]|nr:tetratricopeptide repeat protein [Verrucomicrobiae bacterium]